MSFIFPANLPSYLRCICTTRWRPIFLLLLEEQTYFQFPSSPVNQRRNQKSWRIHISGKSMYSLYCSQFHTEFLQWMSIHYGSTYHNCHTELLCDPFFCCFLTSALISLLKVSNFDLSLLLPVFFAFAWVLFFLRIFLLISGVIQGTEETDLLVFDGICLSAESWIKEVNKSKFSCTERVSEWPFKYFSFANSSVSFLIDS